MRWFVDVSSVGVAAEKQRYCVEADSWQRALQATRVLRADPGPMTGFSIELLDDGFSAVDPIKRQRYAIRKAPADAELSTASSPVSVAPPSAPPAATVPSVPPPASVPDPPVSKPSSRPPAPELKLLAKGEGKRGKTPAPSSVAPPPVATVTAAPAPKPDPAPGPKPSRDAAAPLEILAKREQEPEASKPLTYREYAYLVEGTPDHAESERLLRLELTRVQSAINAAPSGKLVNLALFNVRFTGRPPISPLATLTWKDWRGAPVVSFPDAAADYAPPPSRRISIEPPAEPTPVAVAAPVVEPTPVIVPTPILAAGPVSAPASEPVPDTAPTPAVVVEPTPSVVIAVEPISTAPPIVAEAPATTPDLEKTPGARSEPPPASVPPPSVTSTRRSDRPGPISTRTPNAKGRLRGDELISDLFESMHELQFLQDSIDGADFCLTLALEKMPARGGLVHLYDIDRREYVITCAGGDGGETLLHTRSAESDAVISMAMRKRRSVVFADAQTSMEVQTTQRYTALGGARSLLVAPVALGGRFLGAIELLNPVDDVPFTDDDGYALSYIAEQLASFVGSRGIMLDRDQPAGRLAGSR